MEITNLNINIENTRSFFTEDEYSAIKAETKKSYNRKKNYSNDHFFLEHFFFISVLLWWKIFFPYGFVHPAPKAPEKFFL